MLPACQPMPEASRVRLLKRLQQVANQEEKIRDADDEVPPHPGLREPELSSESDKHSAKRTQLAGGRDTTIHYNICTGACHQCMLLQGHMYHYVKDATKSPCARNKFASALFKGTAILAASSSKAC